MCEELVLEVEIHIHTQNRHTEYTDEQDGSKRCRVRFNLEGQFGNAFVFAEQSSDMKAGEMVYGESVKLLCLIQLDTGHKLTVVCHNIKYSYRTSRMDECTLL
jgi:hypothetical protein